MYSIIYLLILLIKLKNLIFHAYQLILLFVPINLIVNYQIKSSFKNKRTAKFVCICDNKCNHIAVTITDSGVHYT